MSETEQNRSEQATPFKLKRAREKGSVARGTDLGFFSMLAGLTLFSLMAGARALEALAEMMRRTFLGAGDVAVDPQRAFAAIGAAYAPALHAVALLAATIVVVVALLEIIQLRGLVFTTQPLKPDFNRLNPGKNLKRLFSARLLKETLKNIVKLAAYSGAVYYVLSYGLAHWGHSVGDAPSLVAALKAGGFRLLFCFVGLALCFAALDQVLARGEFQKQMRMSRREVTREVREREGEPRLKHKRQQLHAEFAKQTQGFGALKGADMVIVNPDHYAVALAYDAKTMAAPTVAAKGRNHFALLLKRQAAIYAVPIFESPPLARAIFASHAIGEEISGGQYREVADLYLKLARFNRDRSGGADA